MSLKESYSAMKSKGHKMSSGGSCMACGGECKYAGGGDVKGVHTSEPNIDRPSAHSKYPKIDKRISGESRAGFMTKEASDVLAPGSRSTRNVFREGAKDEHRRVLGELKSMPNPKLKGLAKGGEVKDSDMDAEESKKFMEKGDVGKSEKEDPDNDGDEMLHHVVGEFHESLKSGDHKGALESLRALIMSCKE